MFPHPRGIRRLGTQVEGGVSFLYCWMAPPGIRRLGQDAPGLHSPTKLAQAPDWGPVVLGEKRGSVPPFGNPPDAPGVDIVALASRDGAGWAPEKKQGPGP